MEETYYKVIFAIFLLAMFFIRLPHAIKNKKNKNIKVSGDTREKILAFITSVGMVFIPGFWIFSDIFLKFNINFPDWIRCFGIIINTLDTYFFYEIHKALGQNWSPVLKIRKDHTLIKEGPYKRIRHPMYTQIWLWVIAQFLISSNWIVGIMGIVTWALLYFIRVPKEEKLLEETFKEEYEDYKKQTGRIFPKLY